MTEKKITTGKIFFKTDMEEQPVILNKEDYADSFMKETIDFAIERFDKISQQGYGDSNDIINDIAPNNVIAFVGDRGTGKTSCMLSTINIIRQREYDDRTRSGVIRNHFMELLDPSFFDNEHTILDILIGRMYAEFRKDADKNHDSGTKREREMRDLVESFTKVKDCMKFLGRRINYEEDSLDELSNLAAGVTMKREFNNLVKQYCEWFGGRRLIIPIDDIDLNTVQAFEMMELIRKYIIQPNIIIMFAVKIPQLTNAVKLQLTQQYKAIIGENNQIPPAEIARMADRYVEKFIPINCRVHMPDTDAILSYPLEIYTGDDIRYKRPKTGDAVLELIFTKSRYLFYNTEGSYSRIIPRRLRELRQLVMLLYSLPDYDSDESMYADSDTGRQNRYNKTIFKNYFFNAIAETLPTHHREIATALFGNRDYASFNKAVVDYIKTLRKDKEFEKDSKDGIEHTTEGELNRIINDKDTPYNVSLGDVMLYLNYIDDNSADEPMNQLVFFIKSYYSILLYELYDLRNDDIASGQKPEQPEKPLLQNQLLANIDSLRRLIGGSYITLTDNAFLAPNDANDPRERRLIDGDLIKNIISNIKNIWDQYKKNNVLELIKNGEILEDFQLDKEITDVVRDLRTIEFFMLGTQRYAPANSSKDYRQMPDVYYNRQLYNTKNIIFDITAPLFNILDIKAAYDRFDNEIFDICKSLNTGKYRSLYAILTDNGNNTEPSLAPHERQRFLSSVTIRNIEVLDDMCAYIKRYRDTRNRVRPDSTLSDMYARFYHTVGEYVALTYPKETKLMIDDDSTDKNPNYYDIRLTPLLELSEFLKDKPTGDFADTGVNHELFDHISKSVMILADDNVMKNRQKYTRDQILGVITAKIPDVTDITDFQYQFSKSFTKETGTYSMGDITNKLARLNDKLGIDFKPALDPNAAKAYEHKIDNEVATDSFDFLNLDE